MRLGKWNLRKSVCLFLFLFICDWRSLRFNFLFWKVIIIYDRYLLNFIRYNVWGIISVILVNISNKWRVVLLVYLGKIIEY